MSCDRSLSTLTLTNKIERLSLEIQETFTIDEIIAFMRWQANLTKDKSIMGGETVFPNSRLSVRHIGGMLERGEPIAIILEDYPYLSERDLIFARLYTKVYPKLHEIFN